MHGQRNNVLAGLLVIISVILAVVAITFVGGGAEQFGKRKFVVRFPLDTDVTGLKQGSLVEVGGLKVGSVSGLRFEEEAAGEISGIRVTIAVQRSIDLHEGAEALLKTPLLGSGGTINFENLGDRSAPVLPSGALIEGRNAPLGLMKQARDAVENAGSNLLKEAGYGEVQKTQVQRIIGNVDETSDRVNRQLKGFEDEGTFDDIKATASNARQVTDGVREKWPAWSGEVSDILANGGRFFREDLKDRADQVQRILEKAEAFVAVENADNVHDTLANAKDFSHKLNTELSDKAANLLSMGQEAMLDARTSMQDFRETLNEQRPNVRRVMADLRLGADQLRATLVEVRRTPWRMLYRPSDRELNFELLYDSARTYAAAVSDLRAASESLERLSASGGDGAALSDGTANELVSQIDAAFERYEEAERLFLEQLKDQK